MVNSEELMDVIQYNVCIMINLCNLVVNLSTSVVNLTTGLQVACTVH
jgi:hypothetical protein